MHPFFIKNVIILKIKNFTENILDNIFEKYISQQSELQKVKSELEELNALELKRKIFSKNKEKESKEPHIKKNRSFLLKKNVEQKNDFLKDHEADISSNFFINN